MIQFLKCPKLPTYKESDKSEELSRRSQSRKLNLEIKKCCNDQTRF